MTVSYPLGRSYEEASLARADVERRQAAQRIASLRLDSRGDRSPGRRGRCAAPPNASTPRAPARRWRSERLDAEQRRYEVGLSTTFLVTQAQRDLLQAQVNLLQTTLDYESSLRELRGGAAGAAARCRRDRRRPGRRHRPPADVGAAWNLPAGRGSGIPIRQLTISRLNEFHAHRRTDFDGVSGWREPSRLLVDPEDDD